MAEVSYGGKSAGYPPLELVSPTIKVSYKITYSSVKLVT